MNFQHQKYFREPDFSEDWDMEDFEIEKLEKECDKLNSRPAGLNKNKERCLRAVRATYYLDAGLVFEPIIFNLDSKEILVDYKAMGLNRKDAAWHHERLELSPLYKNKKNLCFIFYDGSDYQEFLYTKDLKPVGFLKKLDKIFDNFNKSS